MLASLLCLSRYIERPLLAYDTKLDLRQYYLVVIDKHFIRFWSHPLCAVRLASTEFTLDSYDEQAHITNTSIQMKYRRKSTDNLPHHHMWSTHTLTDYFEKIGKPKVWHKVIYPSIKRTLKAISKVSVDHIDMRPGRFELFGCDWLITEDLKTYLLEINRYVAHVLSYLFRAITTHVQPESIFYEVPSTDTLFN